MSRGSALRESGQTIGYGDEFQPKPRCILRNFSQQSTTTDTKIRSSLRERAFRPSSTLPSLCQKNNNNSTSLFDVMAPNTSHHLAQTVFGSDKLNVAELYKIKGQVALGESNARKSEFSISLDRFEVTGGGSGLGLVTAAALAQNGCKVYITGRRGDVLEQAAKDATPGSETGGEVIPIQADVSDKEGIDSEYRRLQHFRRN